MTRFVTVFILLWAAARITFAQSSESAGMHFDCDNGKPTIHLLYSDSEAHAGLNDGAATKTNYGLYRIVKANKPGMHTDAVDLTVSVPPNAPGSDQVDIVVSVSCDGRQPVLQEGGYILEIKAAALRYKGPPPQTKPFEDVDVTFALGKASVVVASDVFLQDKRIGLRPDADLKTSSFSTAVFQRVSLRVGSNKDVELKSRPLKATYVALSTAVPPVDKIPDFNVNTEFSDGKQYEITATGLTDVWGTPVKADDLIKLPDVPKNDADAKVLGTLSSVAAVHQKAVFELNGKYAPLHRAYDSNGSTVYWDPSIKVDIGLNSTKAANSVLFSYLRRDILSRCTSSGSRCQPPCAGSADASAVLQTYQSWARTGIGCLSDVRFSIGPRIETDRNFDRLNTLAQARFDFDFFRWLGSISDQRARIISDLKSSTKYRTKADLLEGPNSGFSLVPYLEFDAGGHANEETVTNGKTKTSINVARHGIFRVYVGAVGEFDYRRFAFKLDSALIEMAMTEQIGFITSTGVALRHLQGVQPHTLASIDISLDPARHYALNLSYENGRSAPNFEYLSKFATGIKVIY